MKAQGQFTIVIRGSTEATGRVALRSWDGFNYLFHRLLTGQEVAQSEFAHYGIELRLGPAAVLCGAADYLDDGFHEQLVADLREIGECGELEEWSKDDQAPRLVPIGPLNLADE